MTGFRNFILRGNLVELAVEFAQNHLKPQGALVCKVFHGSGYSQLVKLFKERFRVVKPIKPKASRDKSAETFLVDNGKVIAAATREIEIGKSGFERWVERTARRHGFLYGLAAVLLSLLLGWSAAAIFRRRS